MSVAFAAHEFIIVGPFLDNPQRVGTRLEPPLADRHSARRGTYRVIYRIDDEQHTVTVVAISPRSALVVAIRRRASVLLRGVSHLLLSVISSCNVAHITSRFWSPSTTTSRQHHTGDRSTRDRRTRAPPPYCHRARMLSASSVCGREEVSVTSYTATCRREGQWWVVHVPELDRSSQAGRLSQVEGVARSLVATYTQEDPTTAEVTVDLRVPDGLVEVLAAAASAREDADHVSLDAVALRRGLARRLALEGFAVRDIAALIGVSYGGAQQLLGDDTTVSA